jgi:hypothetical protein
MMILKYQLTPSSETLLEKLEVEIINSFYAFRATGRSTAVVIKSLHLTLF